MWRLSGHSRLRAQCRVAVLGLASAAGLLAQQKEPIVPVPLSQNIDRKRVAIGERLFYDVRLSHDNRYSCATCHPLDRGGVDGLPVAKSPTGGPQLRNTLTVFNVGLSPTYNWDGIANSLEHHTGLVLT